MFLEKCIYKQVWNPLRHFDRFVVVALKDVGISDEYYYRSVLTRQPERLTNVLMVLYEGVRALSVFFGGFMQKKKKTKLFEILREDFNQTT